MQIPERPRRNRVSAAIRNLLTETELTPQHFIYPLFIAEDETAAGPVASMPGIYRHTLDSALTECEEALSLGISNVIIFPVIPEVKKNPTGSYALERQNINLRSISAIKKHLSEIAVFTDIALDPYSSDGHDGIVRDGQILNDETLPVLADMAVAQAQAGCDFTGPSDMMDGRIGVIREALDKNGFYNTGIMSYTAKYASSFYGPFRDALDSAPKSGDKKTYQMNPANSREALREARLDTAEGADMLMVKPALAYLDIIQRLKDNSDLPIAAYNVSGEYAMIKAAAEKGWLDGEKTMAEKLLSIRRAGADVILSYAAKEYARFFRHEYGL